MTKMKAFPRRRLYTSVAALVRKLQRRDECIWHWSEYQPGEVDVLLIDRRGRDELRRMKQRLGSWPESGSGRVLVFRKENGRWSLVGEGGWIS